MNDDQQLVLDEKEIVLAAELQTMRTRMDDGRLNHKSTPLAKDWYLGPDINRSMIQFSADQATLGLHTSIPVNNYTSRPAASTKSEEEPTTTQLRRKASTAAERAAEREKVADQTTAGRWLLENPDILDR